MYQFLDKSVGPWLKGRAQDRFANEGDDAVGAWAPLEAATHSIRRSRGFPGEHPINHRTGELERHIVGSGWSIVSSPMLAELEFPGSVPTGKLHDKVKTAQEGSSSPLTPPRPVVGVNEADLAFVLGAMATYLTIASRF